MARVRPSSLRGGLGVVISQPASLSDIGGMDSIKQSLRAAVEWPLLYPEAFAKFGLPQPKGTLCNVLYKSCSDLRCRSVAVTVMCSSKGAV